VVVNAVGNEGYTGCSWCKITAPADGYKVIAVGAVDAAGKRADFPTFPPWGSSLGPTYDGRIKPEVMARGVNTFCATADGKFGQSSGTSLSTPLIAGLCALLLQAHPNWNVDSIRQAITSTASQFWKPDTLYGWGIANAYKASGLDTFPIPELEGILVYPNPFSDQITICLSSNREDEVWIFVLTSAGEAVKKIYPSFYNESNKAFIFTWDGKNSKGAEVANGIYILKISANGKSQDLKVAKLKK
jgi:subtilisin family serine protease